MQAKLIYLYLYSTYRYNNNMIYQKKIVFPPFKRGFHIINSIIERELSDILKKANHGILHLHLLHTSASLLINENSDSDVRYDFERFTNMLVPENTQGFEHVYEGSDDMPAHIKSALYGTSLIIPICNSHIVLGTWQGIYLNEHRNKGGSRSIFCTLIGN